MPTLRSTLLGIAAVLVGLLLVGCSGGPMGTSGGDTCVLPPDLPDDPEACTRYCKVWVEPVYRKRPVLVQKRCGYTQEVPETVYEARYREVCERPRCVYPAETPDMRCDMAVVQVRPGGYKWKRDGRCWRYCYEEPCYQWCNKVVTEEGIDYCVEVPPEYHIEVSHEPVTRHRTEYVPGEYEVKWVDELYRPGHWEWQAIEECERCDCPAPCPTLPQRPSPCPGQGLVPGIPRCN